MGPREADAASIYSQAGKKLLDKPNGTKLINSEVAATQAAKSKNKRM